MPEAVTFFEHQDQAKRRSRWALAGFLLTVVGTVIAITAFSGFVYLQAAVEYSDSISKRGLNQCLVWTAMITLAVIFLSWMIRMLSLSGGPAGVMKSLGGKLVSPDTSETDERRLRNLVEEMAIASGLPVPDVYVIDSSAINACATGLETDKAAVAVTRGALHRLSRDELQGVIAHEFSHILHGDMALNTQLIAWLAGLFTVSEIGRIVMYLTLGGYDSNRDGRRDKGNIGLAAIGAGVWILGSIGVLFGKLLQASLSRQREFLADASAVQYTRNPDGIGNALRKLGDRGLRGRMSRPKSDCAHLMFSPLRSIQFAGWMATHPPLPERIRRIQPNWDGTWLNTSDPEPEPRPSPPRRTGDRMPSMEQVAGTALLASLLERQKAPDQERLDEVTAWKEQLDESILMAARDPVQACALIYLLLLPPDQPIPDTLSETEKTCLDHLRKAAPPPRNGRLPLVDLALPALRRLPDGERRDFLAKVDEFSRADGRIDLFEYALGKVLHQALEGGAGRSPLRKRKHIRQVHREICIMFSVLARLGSEKEEEVQAAFQRAEEYMFGYTAGKKLALLPREQCGLEAMDQACEALAELAPSFQQRTLLAGLAAISADNDLKPAELEAYRAFAAAMHIPVPPNLGFGEIGS